VPLASPVAARTEPGGRELRTAVLPGVKIRSWFSNAQRQ
jgi:hypothetical protein